MKEERDGIQLQLSATQKQYNEGEKLHKLKIDLDAMKEERESFKIKANNTQKQYDEEAKKTNIIRMNYNATKEERDDLKLRLTFRNLH